MILIMKATRAWGAQVVLSLCFFGPFVAEGSSLPGLVVAWGAGQTNDPGSVFNHGQSIVPPGLSNVVAIGGGWAHSLALLSSGAVVAWGAGKTNNPTDFLNYGQSIVPTGLSNVAIIAVGGYHCLVLQSNGTLIAWGRNDYGQASVPAELTNVAAVACGGYHNLVLQSNGVVEAWGYNSGGQTTVPQGLSNVVAIAAGWVNSLALQADGTLVGWGSVLPPPGLSNVIATSAGHFHILALRRGGTVAAWGDNSYGQTTIPPGLSSVSAIAAGGEHSMALQSDGKVIAWGYNALRQTNVPPKLNNVVVIAAGFHHSLAITVGPTFLSQPPSPISLRFSAVTNLEVSVSSPSPFGCQWFLNGLPITGAAETNLVISNFDLTKAGVYSVAVTNQHGAATATAVVRLTNSPVVLVDGADVGGGAVSRTNTSQITMSSTFGSAAHIYYTLDGSAPSYLSIPYQGPFELGRTATIRALAYDSAYLSWAEAAPITVQIWPIYPLAATTPGGGSLSFSPVPYSGGNLFVSNTAVTVTAIPASGWSFLGWLGDASGSSPVATVLMNRDMAVEALFGTTIGTNVLGAGQILFDPEVPAYPFDSGIRITAVPQTGNYLMSWAGALSGSSNPSFLVVTNASPVVTALFGPLGAGQYALTVIPQGAGSVAVSPYTNRYSSGRVVTLTAVASPGESFLGWGGDASGSQNPLSVTMTQTKTITASFTQHPLLSTAPLLNGMVEEGFRFSLIGELGVLFRVDSSPDLASWTPLGWITNDHGVSQILDAAALTNALQFYRAVEQ